MPLLRRPWPCSRRRLLRCRRYAHGPRTTMNCAVIALSCEVAAIVPSHVVVAALHKAAVFGLHDPCCRCCYAARTRVHRRCATISTLSEKKLGTRLLFNISWFQSQYFMFSIQHLNAQYWTYLSKMLNIIRGKCWTLHVALSYLFRLIGPGGL